MRIALLLLALCACRVERKSSRYECETTTDCEAGSTCDDGYCVGSGPPTECPPQCTSCELTTATCSIQCNGIAACGDLACPAGFSCVIDCSGDLACRDISCAAGRDCTVTCSGKRACGDVTCGGEACRVSCSGDRACGDITCDDACACDVTCGAGNQSCGEQTCPTANGKKCTLDGTDNTSCSSFPPDCNSC